MVLYVARHILKHLCIFITQFDLECYSVGFLSLRFISSVFFIIFLFLLEDLSQRSE